MERKLGEICNNSTRRIKINHMEVIYINDTYTTPVLAFYKKYGIVRPTLNKIHTIREIIKPSGVAGHGVLLQEIVNSKVNMLHPILQQMVPIEPNFNINRFTDLQGNVLTKKMMEEWQKERVLVDKGQDS